MENMKFKIMYVIPCLLGFLQSCASPPIDTQVLIFLRPVHEVTTGLHDYKGERADLTDNDGNLYATYWDVADEGHVQFEENVNRCRKDVRDKRLFTRALSIADYQAAELRPTVYPSFVKCIYSYGYHLVAKSGYKPKQYRLSLYRSHSSKSYYMPVGASFTLDKEGVMYRDIFLDVKQCEEEILSTGGDGADELYSSGFAQVSIVEYSEKMQSCLMSRAYNLENHETKKPV